VLSSKERQTTWNVFSCIHSKISEKNVTWLANENAEVIRTILSFFMKHKTNSTGKLCVPIHSYWSKFIISGWQ